MESMPPLDYGRSFLIGKASSNEVRFWVESRTRVIDAAGKIEDYLQVGSCKSEHTFAVDNLFQDDNYDFLPVFGPEWSVVFRRRASSSDAYRETRPSDQWWDGQDLQLIEMPEATVLATNADIRAATYQMAPLVAQVEIANAESGLRAILEFPVKTMNTRRCDDAYQVDSGPVALPDLQPHQRSVDALRLAFVAFNVSCFADFVVEVPTRVASDTHVEHFHQRLSLPSCNRLLALPV